MRPNRRVILSSTGANCNGGASPRAGCRRAASCAIGIRACGSNTGARCSAPSACWPPITPDRRAPVSAPRTPKGRDREPEERGDHGKRGAAALAAEAAHLGIWVQDLTRNDIWATDSWRALFGFAKSERLDLDGILRRLHPDDRETVQSTLARALEGDGRYKWTIAWCSPVARYAGLPAGAVRRRRHPHPRARVSLDVTERRKTNGAQLLRQEVAHVGHVDDGPARVRTGARDQSAARRDPAQCRGGGAACRVHRRTSTRCGRFCRCQGRPACGRRDRPDACAAQAAQLEVIRLDVATSSATS